MAIVELPVTEKMLENASPEQKEKQKQKQAEKNRNTYEALVKAEPFFGSVNDQGGVDAPTALFAGFLKAVRPSFKDQFKAGKKKDAKGNDVPTIEVAQETFSKENLARMHDTFVAMSKDFFDSIIPGLNNPGITINDGFGGKITAQTLLFRELLGGSPSTTEKRTGIVAGIRTASAEGKAAK